MCRFSVQKLSAFRSGNSGLFGFKRLSFWTIPAPSFPTSTSSEFSHTGCAVFHSGNSTRFVWEHTPYKGIVILISGVTPPMFSVHKLGHHAQVIGRKKAGFPRPCSYASLRVGRRPCR